MANKIGTIFSHLKYLFTKRKNRIGKTGFQFSAILRITVCYVTQVGRRGGRFVMFAFNKSHGVKQVAGGSVAKRDEEKNISKGVLNSGHSRFVFEMIGGLHRGAIYRHNPLTKSYELLQKDLVKVQAKGEKGVPHTFLYCPLKKK